MVLRSEETLKMDGGLLSDRDSHSLSLRLGFRDGGEEASAGGEPWVPSRRNPLPEGDLVGG